ncbi:MAG: hypothetical protein MRK01_07435 [Candidatus Scalindua sp.]|nr:hypothetical protein [Candidatus Scalindua sp.]
MSDSEFKGEKPKGTISEPQEEKRTGEGEKATTGLSDYQLWSTFIWKLMRALAATLLGGTLVYFICRLLIS